MSQADTGDEGVGRPSVGRSLPFGVPQASAKSRSDEKQGKIFEFKPITPAPRGRGKSGNQPSEPAGLAGASAASNTEAEMLTAGMGLKLPVSSHAKLSDLIAQGEGKLIDAALHELQANLRWPGELRFEVAEGKAPDPISLTKGHVPLMQGDKYFGKLVLAGGAKSSRVAEQLQQAGIWLASLLAMELRMAHWRRLAETDELSGSFNRRYFLEKVPQLLEKARKDRFCVTLLLFDIDDFKQYNDQFGHAAGDAIIREVIGLLRHCTRPKDLVARIGGDEFAVIFWDNDRPRQPDSEHPRSVLAIAHRFRKAVAEHPWNRDGGPIAGRLSISGGLATFPRDAQSLPQLMEVADGELMRAKAMGKNAIVLAGPQGDPPADA